MMRLCTPLILMLALYQVDSSDRQKVFGNLHETSSLPCPQPCSGLLTWTMFERQDDVLANCTRVSCWSAAGFSLNHDEFLRGDSTLTVLRADYSLRGLYRAECDSETLCQVVFTLNPVEVSRVVTPGEDIDVHLPLTDLVEVRFTPSDAEQPANLQICIMEKEKIHCSPDYKERASLLNTLQIKDGRGSDSGNYTVRDIVNDEIIANVQIHVTGEEPYTDSKQKKSRPAWPSALIAVLVILLIIAVLVIVYQWRENQKLRKGPAHSTHQEHQSTENTSGQTCSNPDVEMSVHIPLTEQQH